MPISLSHIASVIHKTVHDNSPSILTGIGASGTIITAYLTGKATWRARGRLSEGPPTEDMTKREIVEEVWDLYIPPVIAGVLTVSSVLGANHISSKRMAAAYSVAAVVEKGFEEYREKVVEQMGETKEKAVRDEIAQDRIEKNPPGQLVVTGTGTVLCCEMFTGRYFNSDMETLKKSQNEINAKLIREMYATLNDFYFMIGLPFTSESGAIGWEVEKLMQLEFSTVISPDQKPCIAFDYNYTRPL